MAFDPKRQLAGREVRQLLGDLLSFGELIYSRHARERMAERGYTYRDIHKILLTGAMIDSQENHIAGNWKYTFRGDDRAGDTGAVVVALVQRRECVVITVLSS